MNKIIPIREYDHRANTFKTTYKHIDEAYAEYIIKGLNRLSATIFNDLYDKTEYTLHNPFTEEEYYE